MSKRAELLLDMKKSIGTINPLIYGHFSEHIGGVFYDGLWVGEDSKIDNIRGFRKSLVESFRKIHPSVLRWPGGCFAETYDWRDGIGPRDRRPERINWWYDLDKRTESNAVGTHEFIDFCRMVGAEPYIAANVTTTYALNIRNWIEYCNMPEGLTTLTRLRGENGHPAPFNVQYWGIGNENWGGGGQMTPEMYAREYLRYITICRPVRDENTKFIMCGANSANLEWTRRLLKEWRTDGHRLLVNSWGMSLHYYCGTAGTPQEFTEDEWYQLMFQADLMKKVVDGNSAAMYEFDPDRRLHLVVDEWGCWHQDGTGPSKGYNLFEQQSNMRDAVVAALTLNTFNNRCDVVAMANVAQLCNNLHSLYLAGGENFVETPNYHVFDMFKTHQGGRQIAVRPCCETLEREGFSPLETLSASASEKDGKVTITLANLNVTDTQNVKLTCAGGELKGKAVMTVLRSADPHTCNTFENPTAVTPTTSEITLTGDDVIDVPAASVVSIVIDKE